MRYYPIAIGLDKRLAVVAGGGKVAERKALGLLRAGARVKIISPSLTPQLRRIALQNGLAWVRRNVRAADLKKAAIIVSATNERGVNRAVSRWAKAQGSWVNVADDSRLSDFISPAVFRRSKAIVAVYSDGRDPELSRDLKNFLRGEWDEFLSYRDKLQKRSP